MLRRNTPMRILITNTSLSGRTGTEIFVAQLAEKLRSRGHEVLLYSPLVGELGLKLRSQGHFVYERIEDIHEAPDVIHAHHVGPTICALAAFPGTPAIFIMHSVDAEYDAPPLHPQIASYHAVSSFIRKQRATSALPAAKIGIVRNAVDLARFRMKSVINTRPERASAVINNREGLQLIRAACITTGLVLEEIGPGVGRVLDDLPKAFESADIVFASGRSALEALASGCAVVLTGGGRFGGLVQPRSIDLALELNLGVRTLNDRLTQSALEAAIRLYASPDVIAVSKRVRELASLDEQAQKLEALYLNAIERPSDLRNASRMLARLIEAYVPSHGELPWQRLTRAIVQGSLGAQMDELTKHHRFNLGPEPRGMLGVYRFAEGELGCRWLADGWWSPEDWGVWSSKTATLIVPVSAEASQISMQFRLFSDGINEFDRPVLHVGGTSSRDLDLSETPALAGGIRNLKFNVSAANLSTENTLTLTFSIPNARKPADSNKRGLSSTWRWVDFTFADVRLCSNLPALNGRNAHQLTARSADTMRSRTAQRVESAISPSATRMASASKAHHPAAPGCGSHHA